MRKRILSISLIFTVLIACSTNEEPRQKMAQKNDMDGPHVFIRQDSLACFYLTRKGRKWKVQQKTIEKKYGVQIPFQTPVNDTLFVQYRKIDNPVFELDKTPHRILAISDIEGNFEALYSLLRSHNIITEKATWNWGDGQLVLLGDILDRGQYVTETLWFLYKLQDEALKAGGNVHIVLGNHEVMIFQGDIRYIHRKYKKQVEAWGKPYVAWYSTETIIGQWLRNQPAILRLGSVLFSHAGISPEVMALDMSISEINTLIREINQEDKRLGDKSESQVLYGSNGIFWYRNWVDNPPSEEFLNQVLETYKAEHMVVGHTIVPKIQSRYDNKLLTIDIIQPADGKSGKVRALLIEEGTFYQVINDGKKERLN